MPSNPCYVVADHISQQFKKLKSLMDIRKSLASLSSGSGCIERTGRISQHEFLERYYAANKPVILTGLLSDSLARQRWTPEYLAEICGEATVQIMQGRHFDPDTNEIPKRTNTNRKCPRTYAWYSMAGPVTISTWSPNNGFFNLPETQALLNEAPNLGEYLDPSDYAKAFFWFGPPGTVTPLHHDIMNILVAEVYGRKLSPDSTGRNNTFTITPGVHSDVDCHAPDYSRHPLYRYANPISVVIDPGDVLFIPVGWWHHVEALDISIMVSINFRFPNSYEWFHPNIQ